MMARVRTMQAAAAEATQPVPSPCVSICRMDPAGGLCVGCLRTIDEIAQWSTMTDDDKRAVLGLIEARAGQVAWD